jgi:PAS domain S-box-containing protein
MPNGTFDRWLLGAGGLIILLAAAVVLTFHNTRQLNEDAQWVAHTHEVLDKLSEATGHLRESALIQRSYLLVGGETNPAGFAEHIDSAKQKVSELRVLTEDNKEQQDRIPEIEAGIDELARFWSGTMTERNRQGLDAAGTVVTAGQGREMMAVFQGRMREIEETERGLLRERSVKRERTYRSALATALLSGVAAMAGVVAFMVLLRRHLAERTAAAAVIAEQGERLRTTLASIGDAVITTDIQGRITGMNPVAESLTGWGLAHATGQPLDSVFHIVNEESRQRVGNPAATALTEGIVVGLANHTLLVARDGMERPIDDSAAPIRCQDGEVVGCVLVFRDISERRALEMDNANRLRAARLLAAIVESSEDAIVSKSLDGIIQSWNAAAQRLFGYTSEEAVGRHISLIIPRDRLAEEDQIIATLKAGRRIEHYDTVRVRSDGRPVWVSLTISPIKDESGRVVGASKIARDITDKRQAEERERRLLAEAAAANAKFRAFFEQGALFAGIMDVDGTIIEPNRLSCEGCGYTKEQIVGKPFWDGPWWTPSAALVERIKAASAQAAEGQTFRAETPYYIADGSERVVDVTILPITDQADRVLFLALTGIDITERKRAEADRQKFVTLVENSTDFIGMCDLEGHPFYINRAGLDMIGLEGIEHARHVPVQEFFFPEDQSMIMDEFFPSVLAQGHGELEARFRHFQTGQAIWMAYKVLTVTDPGGQAVAFATVSQEVTERRRMEDHLRTLASDLSEADRRKDEFLATLAHELRNPLAPIRNALQVMRLSSDRPTSEHARTLMERQLAQMVRLVDDLLDVSRITRGKLELRKERVPISTIVHSAIETSRPLIDHMEHELTLKLPRQPIVVDADPTRLAQVLSNLLNNAAKYMDRGGHIELTVERRGSDVVVSVKDRGIGVAADQLPRLFEMFSQVDHSLEKSQGGLGIGLTLAKRLVEMHGGRIEARSEGIGQGAEFVLRLPVALGACELQPPLEPDEPPASSSSLRILIVDDNRDSAESLGMLLQILGHEIRTAHDGQGGVAAAEEFRPDIVLLDIGMPKLNGYEACRRIREQSWARGAYMIALTGWGQEADRRRSQEAGFDRHLVKPVDPQELMVLLAELNGAKG